MIAVPFDIRLETVRSGYDRQTCWVHPRAGVLPGERPVVVMTLHKLRLTGSDVFSDFSQLRSDDVGQTWTGPVSCGQVLERRPEGGGIEVTLCDFTPKWHAASGVLLGTGQTVRYRDGALMRDPRPRETAYAVYDPGRNSWSDFKTLAMPDEPRFFSAGAGSTQRHDLPGGDILLPVYAKPADASRYFSTVVRCEFDGRTLRYLNHGSEVTVADGRGLYEPSIVRFGEGYYLTLRNDVRGYVARSRDGLSFDEPRPWTFDDGSDLGNYNTQQHWVSHPRGLFLVYTRRDADNDHVFRHRAPLFIAQVDPDRLCVVRDTERVLIPNRGARLCNFGVTEISPAETWVTVAEWMQSTDPDPHDCRRCERYGSDNTIWAARICWG